ncbi:MAG: lysostaphin resistance A-like protein [Thermoanaerobacteraceae bacterium]
MRPDVKDVSKIYLFIMILFITAGYFLQKSNLYFGIIFTEVFFVLMPVFIYLLINRFDLVYVLRLNKLEINQSIVILGIAVFGWVVAGFFMLLMNYFLYKLGHIPVQQLPPPYNFTDMILQVLIFGAVAAFCEELLMRGLIMRSFELIGSIRSIFITALLFAMLHLNIQNFFSIFFLGILLGYVVYRTDSIFGGILLHFTNNTISIIISYIFLSRDSGNMDFLQKTNIPFSAIIIYGIFALVSAIILYLLLKILEKLTDPYVIKMTGNLKYNFNILNYWPLFLSFLIFMYRITNQILKIAGVI